MEDLFIVNTDTPLIMWYYGDDLQYLPNWVRMNIYDEFVFWYDEDWDEN